MDNIRYGRERLKDILENNARKEEQKERAKRRTSGV